MCYSQAISQAGRQAYLAVFHLKAGCLISEALQVWSRGKAWLYICDHDQDICPHEFYIESLTWFANKLEEIKGKVSEILFFYI
jgi:hypothetical protein